MKRATRRKALPRKLSSLILVANADNAAVSRSKRYQVSMNFWHVPSNTGKCAVCYAGGVMVRGLGARHGEDYMPDDFSGETPRKLRALNQLRQGEVGDAGYELGLESDKITSLEDFNRIITPYSSTDNGKAFRADMKKLAMDLKAAGF